LSFRVHLIAKLTDRELHERLMLRNEQTKQVRLPEVYKEDENAKVNVSTWMNAQYIHEAVPHLLPVSLLSHPIQVAQMGGANAQVPYKRLTDTFRKQNYQQGYIYTPGGKLPPRRGVPGAPPTPTSPEFSASPASPPRKVVSDFKAFGSASGSASVFSAPILATGPGGGMFGSAGKTPAANGGMRGRGNDSDEEEDEDDDGARFTKSSISIEQVS
jgi:hypothetical protein